MNLDVTERVSLAEIDAFKDRAFTLKPIAAAFVRNYEIHTIILDDALTPINLLNHRVK